ncbi:DUF6884 domain-containing protein [Marinobacter sp. tcs-11]|uniref:DUF6884 domain-containing protein n=1 Tax=Marinobacter sp. tcs-11 TaxID=1742860 RepID=UPI00257D4F05|nr:DUF6884 domain-containing protein [Marinobacter sp. tcs-11]
MTAITHLSKVTLLELLARMQVRRVQIISSCTQSKTRHPESPLTWTDFEKGSSWVTKREAEIETISARNLYCGRQHKRVCEIIAENPSIQFDFKIVSAGYGLIDADQPIASYDATFSGLPKAEIARRSIILGLPQAFRNAVERTDADLTLVLLGQDYLDACAVSTPLLAPCPTLLVGNAACRLRIDGCNLFQIPVEEADCQSLGAGQVWVKAEIANQIIRAIAA